MRIKNTWMTAIPLLVIAGLSIAACGGGGKETAGPVVTAISSGGGGVTVSVRGTVTQINESSDGEKTESLVVEVDGQELIILLGEEVDQGVWNPSHLKGHLFFEEAIGIVYKRENGELIAVELSE
ncbi:MAG: hypothetical protein ACE5KI_03765 [Dehalococcoidia bacterium]